MGLIMELSRSNEALEAFGLLKSKEDAPTEEDLGTGRSILDPDLDPDSADTDVLALTPGFLNVNLFFGAIV